MNYILKVKPNVNKIVILLQNLYLYTRKILNITLQITFL